MRCARLVRDMAKQEWIYRGTIVYICCFSITHVRRDIVSSHFMMFMEEEYFWTLQLFPLMERIQAQPAGLQP